MTDLPPGFRIVITNATCDHATTYVIHDVLNVGNVDLIFALMALDDGEQDVQVTLIIEQTDPASGQP